MKTWIIIRKQGKRPELEEDDFSSSDWIPTQQVQLRNYTARAINADSDEDDDFELRDEPLLNDSDSESNDSVSRN